MPSPKWLQRMTWEEFKLNLERCDVIIIPVGSTEQHGGHLPLGTDTFVANTLAEGASEQTGAIIAPPVWYGWSPHHMVLPGTVTIRPEILIGLLFDIIEALAHHGAEKFVVINGHRIVNISWMQIACEKAQRVLGIRAAIFDPSYMSKEIVPELEFGPVGHGDEIESSHMLYSYPELYRAEKVLDYIPDYKPLLSADPAFQGDTLCYIPSTIKNMEKSVKVAKGISGSPSRSCKRKGERYHKHLVQRLSEVINNMQEKEE
ncbi:MAG: creatininase family protein [Firmicutes bacterium]|jgi:creatinine amidohydrolase|nr:creatininase family protein [Bacillota bacterium]